MRNIFLYFIGNIEFFYIRIIFYSLQFVWLSLIAYLTLIEEIFFLESIEGFIVFLVSTFLFLKYSEKLSNWFKWYFVSHSLAVLDNLPEAIGFNMKRMGAEWFGKKQAWNSYNSIKGYSSETLKLWIMFGKYKIFWSKIGHEFNFDITYLGKAWFDENFTRLTGATIPTVQEFTTNARKNLSDAKRYDLLYKYDLIDKEGKLKTGEKKYE